MRFAVIGCGKVSEYLHLPSVTAFGETAELTAIVDIDEGNLARTRAVYPQAAAFTDYREVLTGNRVDAVVIATRTDTHVTIAAAAFAAGKHVLLEKPPAPTIEEARSLLELQRKAGLVCAVNFILRYSAGYRQMRQWLQAGEIGALRAIRLIDDWWGADHRGAYPGRGMRLYAADRCVIVGEGVHYADLARWFSASEYDRIHCVGTSISLKPYPDHQAMIATMKNGVVVNIESSHAYGFASKDGTMDRQADLIGDAGVIKWFETAGSRLSLYGRDRTEHKEGVHEDKQGKLLYEDFMAACSQGRATATLPTLADGVAALEAVIHARESSESGRG